MDRAQAQELVDVHEALQKKDSDLWDELTRWYQGVFWGGEATAGNDDVEMHTNYGYALLDSMSASLVPQNPRGHAKPVSHEADVLDRARLAERMLDQDIRGTLLDELTRIAVRQTILAGRWFAKCAWVQALKAPRAQLVDARRLWWDFDVALDASPYIIEARTVRSDWLDAKIAAGAFNPDGLVDARDIQAIPSYLMPRDQRGRQDSQAGDGLEALRDRVRHLFRDRLIYEVHLLREERMLLFMRDAQAPLYDGPRPYRLVSNPYVQLGFNDNLRDQRGMSDLVLIRALQQRLNEMDQLAQEHALRSLGGTLYDKAALDEDDAAAVAAMKPGEMRGVKVPNNKDIRHIIATLPGPTLSPDFHIERNRIEASIAFVVGLPEWSRGQISSGEHPATEFALTEQSLKNRFTLRAGRVRDFHRGIVSRFALLRQEFMAEDEEVFVPGLLPDEAPLNAKVDDLMAVAEFEIVAYDPMEYNKTLRRAELMKYRAMWLGAPHIDMVKVDQELARLGDIDPSVVIAGPMAPAQAALGAQTDLAAAAAGLAPGAPMPPVMNPPIAALAK